MAMTMQDRAAQFVGSLRDWGCIFMLAVWLQSVMVAAIAMKGAGNRREGSIIHPDGEYFRKRDELLKREMSCVWDRFKEEFPAELTEEEELVADMIILIRNQLAHCHISTGREHALFLPKASSEKLLAGLKNAGWIETLPDAKVTRNGSAGTAQ